VFTDKQKAIDSFLLEITRSDAAQRCIAFDSIFIVTRLSLEVL